LRWKTGRETVVANVDNRDVARDGDGGDELEVVRGW
jgi:hypothetical protein